MRRAVSSSPIPGNGKTSPLLPIDNNSPGEEGSNQAPSLSGNNKAPAESGVNKAPPLPGDDKSPAESGSNKAPPLSQNNMLPSLTLNPSPSYPTGSSAGEADPTAFAREIGPAQYDFPAFSLLMASATVGVDGASPSGGPNSYMRLQDADSTALLASAADGNLYLAPFSTATSPSTSFYCAGDSVTVADENQRFFHYYPATMAAYGVSRLRLSIIMESPLTSQLVTLIPVKTENGNNYVAADTEGNVFLLAVCEAKSWLGAKVFLVKDYDDSLARLAGREVQWVVTGEEVVRCAPLLLTSSQKPFA